MCFQLNCSKSHFFFVSPSMQHFNQGMPSLSIITEQRENFQVLFKFSVSTEILQFLEIEPKLQASDLARGHVTVDMASIWLLLQHRVWRVCPQISLCLHNPPCTAIQDVRCLDASSSTSFNSSLGTSWEICSDDYNFTFCHSTQEVI